MLRKRRLLYLTASRLAAYTLSRGRLALEASFERDDAGLAAYSAFLAGSRNLYYLVVDVVEEDYQQDTIPYLGRKDRRLVLARKLGQRYRDTSLALSLSLGHEQSERRNEKVLYVAFSNTQQFQPWLNALEQQECRLAGIYSTALLAPAVIRGAGLKPPRCLLVSVQQTGLRQSFVEDGKIRFSRVGRLNLEDAAAVAATCAAESARMQQYLVTMRQLPTAATRIDVMVLAPGRYQAELAQACRSSEVLKFHLISAEDQCRASGLKSFPADAPCEALFLRTLENAPSEQFAQEQHRHQYLLWQLGRILYACGAAVLLAGLLYAGVREIDIYALRGRIQSEQARFQTLNAEYARITSTFPHTPTSTENLKATIRQFRLLQAQTAAPAGLFDEVSKALEGFPQVEIDRIEWSAGKSQSAAGSAKRAEPRAAVTAAAGAAAAPADTGLELATISARITGARRADLRTITDMAAKFVATLKKDARLEVTRVHMPFAVTAGDTLTGDIGSERATAESAAFSFTIGRKLGR